MGTHRGVGYMVRIGFGVRLGGALEALRQHRQLPAAVGPQLRLQRGVRLAVFEVLRSVLRFVMICVRSSCSWPRIPANAASRCCFES